MPTTVRHNGGNTHSSLERDEKMKLILQLREQGASQLDISVQVDVSQGTISRWLRLPQYASTGPVGKMVASRIREQLGEHGERAARIAEGVTGEE